MWWVVQEFRGELLPLCSVVDFMQGHVTFKDVFVYFSWEEWGLLDKAQRLVSHTVFSMLCAYVLTVFLGKAPHTPVFWAVFYSFFPQRLPFSSHSCHGHCCFPSLR